MLDKKYVSLEETSDPYAFFLPLFQSAARESNIDIIKDGRARQIALIVDSVSWSTEKKLRATGKWNVWHDECVELHCVQDADRLDAIGAFGTFPHSFPSQHSDKPFVLLPSTSPHQVYYVALPLVLPKTSTFPLSRTSVQIIPWEHSCRPLHTPQDDTAAGLSAIQHFSDKLIHIREGMKTQPGKQLAVKRHQLVGQANRIGS